MKYDYDDDDYYYYYYYNKNLIGIKFVLAFI